MGVKDEWWCGCQRSLQDECVAAAGAHRSQWGTACVCKETPRSGFVREIRNVTPWRHSTVIGFTPAAFCAPVLACWACGACGVYHADKMVSATGCLVRRIDNNMLQAVSGQYTLMASSVMGAFKHCFCVGLISQSDNVRLRDTCLLYTSPSPRD